MPPALLLCSFQLYSDFVKHLPSFHQLLKTLEDTPSLRQISEQVSDTSTHTIAAKNVIGSLKSITSALVWKRSSGHVLIVTPDDESAEAMLSDLENIIDAASVLWYAESDKKLALDAEHLDTQLVGVTGALTELVSMPRACIVAPAHALIFPVPAPVALSQNLLEIRRGAHLKFDEFITTLTTSGFDRKDFVETQGDIAVRGGLVDVFAPGMENPIRIEFFGDEIDSLREFDPLSQRSIKELNSAEEENKITKIPINCITTLPFSKSTSFKKSMIPATSLIPIFSFKNLAMIVTIVSCPIILPKLTILK